MRQTLVAIAVATAAFLASPPLAGQQPGVISGIVLGTGAQPVAAAQVQVIGTTLGTTTDSGGRFRIAGLSGSEVTVEVRRIGYRPERRLARVGDMNLSIAMTEQSIVLDQVVITGTAGGQSKRELGNAVTTINAVQTKEIAPINSLQNLLAGRAPGVFINSATGNVGAGARVRIRGASSVTLSNEPLLYVDGIRVNSAPATGFSNQAFGSGSISRMNDINPDDIESIEIIKGPAAATLYGTEASNGVIQIITKKGTAGAPRWTFATRQGTNYMPDPEGRWPVNWAAVPLAGGPAGALDTVSIDIIELENARGTPVFRSGHLQEYDLGVSGGTSQFTYFAGAGMEDTQGVEPTSTVKRYSGRLNVNVVPSPTITMGLSVGYVNGDIRLPCEAGCGGRALGTIWANPLNNVPLANGDPNPRRGFNSGLPEQYDLLTQYWQGVNRFTGGVQLEHTPRSWFRHRVSAGTDRVTESDNFLAPRSEDSLTKTLFTGWQGSRDIRERQVNNYTLEYSASGIWDPRVGVRSTTSFGAQYYRNSASFLSASGTIFPTVGLTALSATNLRTNPTGDLEEDATLGFYLQEQVGWRDRLYLTAAVRADDNSAFGQNFDRVYYPKFSASWVITEEPFWRWPTVNAVKLRAAYGESGKQPITYSALQTYASAPGANDVASVTPQALGNAGLGPERSKEFEVGFDLGALDDRLGVELTYYRKQTVDAILDRQVAPSVGVPGTQPFNAGSIRNWGTELLLRATPVLEDVVEWNVTFGWANNDSKIESLGTSNLILESRREATCAGYVPGTSDPATCPIADFIQNGLPVNAIKHQVGHPIGSYFEQRVVSASFQSGANSHLIDPTTVMCDDGNGGSKLCAGADLIYGNADDAPDVFLGRSLPTVEGSVGNSVTLWRRFRVYALVDFKLGFKKLDGNIRSRCAVFGRCRENFYPTEFDANQIAGLQSNGNLVDYFINNSGYTKLREVSFSYTLPQINMPWVNFDRAVLTLAGRNLATWTDYPGLEPEAFFLGGARGGNFGQFEQTTNPQLRQWVLGLNIDW